MPHNIASDLGLSTSSTLYFSGSREISTFPNKEPREGSLCLPPRPEFFSESTPSLKIRFFRMRELVLWWKQPCFSPWPIIGSNEILPGNGCESFQRHEMKIVRAVSRNKIPQNPRSTIHDAKEKCRCEGGNRSCRVSFAGYLFNMYILTVLFRSTPTI
jgi:hypothetical protein